MEQYLQLLSKTDMADIYKKYKDSKPSSGSYFDMYFYISSFIDCVESLTTVKITDIENVVLKNGVSYLKKLLAKDAFMLDEDMRPITDRIFALMKNNTLKTIEDFVVAVFSALGNISSDEFYDNLEKNYKLRAVGIKTFEQYLAEGIAEAKPKAPAKAKSGNKKKPVKEIADDDLVLLMGKSNATTGKKAVVQDAAEEPEPQPEPVEEMDEELIAMLNGRQ